MTTALTAPDQRLTPWMGLGTDISAATDAADAIRIAGLDFTVEKFPIQVAVNLGEPSIAPDGTLTGGIEILHDPKHVATVRRNPGTGKLQILGAGMTKGYTIVQPLEAAVEIQAAAEATAATFSSAGSDREGTKMYVAMKLPDTIRIGGFDPVELYLTATNSFDGSGALYFAIAPVRMACTNMGTLLRTQAQASLSIRHTANIHDRMRAAGQVLGLTKGFAADYEAVGNQLLNTPMSRPEFTAFVDAVHKPEYRKTGKHAGEETHTTQLRREQLHGLWTSVTQDGISGTRWGALQTVIEQSDWFSFVQAERKDPLARAERLMDGKGADVKSRALRMLLSA